MSEKNSIEKAQEIAEKYGTFGEYFDTGSETAKIVLKEMIEKFPTQRQMLEIYLNGDVPKNKEVIEVILRYKDFNPKVNKKGEISTDLYSKLETLSNIKQKVDISFSGMNYGLSFATTNEIEREIKEIEKDETLGCYEKEAKLKSLKYKRDVSLVDIGNRYMEMVKTLGSLVPAVGNIIGEIADTGKNILNTASYMIMEHNRQLEEILNEINGVNSGQITEVDIKRLSKNSNLAIYYNDITILKQIGIIDLIKKDPKASEDLKHFEKDWAKLNSTISKINYRLVELGDNQSTNETVENVYKYTIKNGSEFVRKGKENAKQSYDPLVIDLDNDGFDMKKIENGVYFDLDENEFKEKTSWVDKKDGILSVDLNKDGKIDKGSEIFGDTFLKKDGTYATSSIDALASYDENNDRIIDKNDKIFDELLVWQDINGDGISDVDELKKLSEYNISSINLNERQSYGSKINGSTLKNTITYTKIDDENKIKGKIGEFLLEKDNIDIVAEDLLDNIDDTDTKSKELAEKIKQLPNMRAFGRVNTLHNEMFLDKTGQLIKLVEQFSQEESMDKKDEILDKILIKIGKAESIDENERGQYINGKYVKVLENLFDEELEKGQLNQRRAEFYKGSYNNIKQMYYAMLTIQTKFKEIDGLFSIKDNKMVNIELLNNYTYLKMLENPETSIEYFKEMSRVMLYLDSSNV